MTNDRSEVSAFAGRPPVVPAPEVLRQRMEQWHQAMELSNAMLMAGLRHKVGPDGDVYAAYREWYQHYSDRKLAEQIEVQEQRAQGHEPALSWIEMESDS